MCDDLELITYETLQLKSTVTLPQIHIINDNDLFSISELSHSLLEISPISVCILQWHAILVFSVRT